MRKINVSLKRFVDCDGLSALLDFLSSLDYETAQGSVHTSLLGCLKALMNNSVQNDTHLLCSQTTFK